MKSRPAGGSGNEYRIEELAELAKTTVRNIRVYQEKGLLTPPTRRGRTAWYTDEHREWLQRITQLLDRGYTFATIAELFTAERSGVTVSELIDAESSRALKRSKSKRTRMSVTAFEEMMGVSFSPEMLTVGRESELVKFTDEGDIEFVDDGIRELIHRLAELGVDTQTFDAFAAGSVAAMDDMVTSLVALVENISENLGDSAPYTRTCAEFGPILPLSGSLIRKLYLQIAMSRLLERFPQEEGRDTPPEPGGTPPRPRE